MARMPASTTVRLWSLDGDVPADLSAHTVGSGPGHRFALLNRLVAEVPAHSRRDGMVFVDDDIRFVVGDIPRLVATAARLSLDLYQPAHSAKSHANWAFVRRHALTCARRTDFVEQGPLIGLSARAQRSLLPFPEDLGMAWGVEVRWWSIAVRDRLVQGIVDAAVVEHLTGTAQEYDRGENELRLKDELRRGGLADLGLLQRTSATARTSSTRRVPSPRSPSR
jgi:hypothetical protein